MKRITEQQIGDVINGIFHDAQETAKLKRENFIGVQENDVIEGIKRRIGTNWVLVKEPPVKFTKDDIAAVANSRFFRSEGMKLLLVWAIIVIAFAMLSLTFKIIPLWAYYSLSIVVTIAFLFLFSKKQKQVRDELKDAVYGSDKVEADRG